MIDHSLPRTLYSVYPLYLNICFADNLWRYLSYKPPNRTLSHLLVKHLEVHRWLTQGRTSSSRLRSHHTFFLFHTRTSHGPQYLKRKKNRGKERNNDRKWKPKRGKWAYREATSVEPSCVPTRAAKMSVELPHTGYRPMRKIGRLGWPLNIVKLYLKT